METMLRRDTAGAEKDFGLSGVAVQRTIHKAEKSAVPRESQAFLCKFFYKRAESIDERVDFGV